MSVVESAVVVEAVVCRGWEGRQIAWERVEKPDDVCVIGFPGER